MATLRYILFDKGLLPVYQDGAVPYLLLSDMPQSLRLYLGDWQRQQSGTERATESLPPGAVSEFSFFAFLIEKDMTRLL